MEYMATQMDRQIEGAQLRYDDALKDGEQPAFPVAANEYGGHGTFFGMTLRDYFAAKALATVPAYDPEDVKTWLSSDFASHAYAVADAMLAARSA